MSGYIIKDQSKAHFVTFTIVNWVDLFTRQDYKQLIVENLNYCIRHKGLTVFAYVIMSNHIHLIIQSQESNLSNIIRDFKKFTSKPEFDYYFFKFYCIKKEIALYLKC